MAHINCNFSFFVHLIDINDCADNPCINGKCTDGIDSYECTCEPGYQGQNCEESKK